MTQRRLLDMPDDWAQQYKASLRSMVILGLLQHKSDEAIYRVQIDGIVEAFRAEGHDEADLEVIAATTRREVADLLAEFRKPRKTSDWQADIKAALELAEGMGLQVTMESKPQ